jgi:hypothetical protein
LTIGPSAASVFTAAASPLPVASNLCSGAALAAILGCLDTAADPLMCELPLTDACSLIVFEAPDETDVDIEALAQRLLQMILAADVAPFVPVLGDVHGAEFDIVIGDLMSLPPLAGIAERVFALGKIGEIAGPVSGPVLVTAEDVVVRLLWDALLPEVPVRPRAIEEMIEDELDGMDFELAGEEMPELPEELEIMLSYKPKKAMRADE